LKPGYKLEIRLWEKEGKQPDKAGSDSLGHTLAQPLINGVTWQSYLMFKNIKVTG
jgi:hypothetical protein